MRPLRGVVVAKESSALTIKLESGITTTIESSTAMGIGDTCWVSYNFEKGTFGSVFQNRPNWWLEEMPLKEPPAQAPTGIHEEEFPNLLDSGALQPCSESLEFWNPDSGVLEIES